METNVDERPGTRPGASEPPGSPDADRVIILDEEWASPGGESLRREAKHWLSDIAR